MAEDYLTCNRSFAPMCKPQQACIWIKQLANTVEMYVLQKCDLATLTVLLCIRAVMPSVKQQHVQKAGFCLLSNQS